jgi:CO dehydrogenase maturation factor
LNHLVLGSNEDLIMDMEAGIEHLGRATAQSMDVLLVVVDEGPWSVQTARRVRKLAQDLGLKKLAAVVNRTSETTDLALIRQALDGIPIVGTLPYDRRLVGGIIQSATEEHIEPTEVLVQRLPCIDGILRRQELSASS